MKKSKDKYLTAKKVLSEKEYQRLKELEAKNKKRELLNRLKNLQSRENILSKREAYSKSYTGKLGSSIAKGFNIGRTGIVRSLYSRGQTSNQSGFKTGKRGRPVGTVKYTDERGNPIGVYEYRKLLNARLRMQRLQTQQQSQYNPEELEAIRRIKLRNTMQQMNPEGRVIPDTYGSVYLDGLMDEINNASNIVN